MNELEQAQAALKQAQEAQEAQVALGTDVPADAWAAGEAAIATAQEAVEKAKTAARYTQSDMDRVAAKTRDEVRQQAKRDQEAAQKRADEERQKASGEWQKIAEDREARVADLEKQLAAKEVDVLRTQVAAKHKLPSELAELLKGTTEAELDTHAASLAKHIAPPKAPANENGAARPATTAQRIEERKKALQASGEYSAL